MCAPFRGTHLRVTSASHGPRRRQRSADSPLSSVIVKHGFMAREGTRSSLGARKNRLLQTGVVVQVALPLVLLLGSALMMGYFTSPSTASHYPLAAENHRRCRRSSSTLSRRRSPIGRPYCAWHASLELRGCTHLRSELPADTSVRWSAMQGHESQTELALEWHR
jgi:hypothetical protein